MTAAALPRGWSAVLGPLAGPEAVHPLDAHAWRFEANGISLLFDAGAGFGPAPKAADALFLTHGHGDHALGAFRLRLPTFAAPLTAQWLGAGDEDRISLPKAVAAGIYPRGTRLTAVPGITAVAHGQTQRFGPTSVTAIATPGHSADHTAWLVETAGARVLIGGDAIFECGTVVLQDTWDCSVADTCATVRTLAALAPDAILPGHGLPLIGGDCSNALAAAMARVDRLLPPKLFL
jgi:glyoxylase-like metal-dependent hydrolase (beta-lactamase superfamily II)